MAAGLTLAAATCTTRWDEGLKRFLTECADGRHDGRNSPAGALGLSRDGRNRGLTGASAPGGRAAILAHGTPRAEDAGVLAAVPRAV